MSGAVDKVVKVASFGLADDVNELVKIGTLGAVDSTTSSSGQSADAISAEAQEQAQTDATNAARISEAATKKKATSTSVLTSPLGTSQSATTAITKLGGM